MESNLKVTFWLNKTKKNSLNLTPVCMRVAYDYAHFTLSTGIQGRVQDCRASHNKWQSCSNRSRGHYLPIRECLQTAQEDAG